VLLFLDLLKPLVLFMIEVQIQAPSIGDVVNFSSIEGFGISMATSWVDASYSGSIFCVFLNFSQNVHYSNATNTL
jgi:deoxycytidine triphosphate deaminase